LLTAKSINELRKELENVEKHASTLKNLDQKKIREIIHTRQKEIRLLESAFKLNNGEKKAQLDFVECSKDLYGSVSESEYASILKSEFDWMTTQLHDIPVEARSILNELLELWPTVRNTQERSVSNSELKALKLIVRSEFAPIAEKITSEWYEPKELVDVFNTILKDLGYAKSGWCAKLDEQAQNLSVLVNKKQLLVSPFSSGSRAIITQKAIHEIGVHIKRAHEAEKNGNALLTIGFDNYLQGEEGLGIAAEVIWDESEDTQSIERARRRYLFQGLALGIDEEEPRNFVEVYEIMWRRDYLHNYTEAGKLPDKTEVKQDTCRYLFRTFRGSDLQAPGIVLTRGHVYLDGYRKTIDLMLRHQTKEFLQLLLRGKYNHTDPKQLEYVRNLQIK